MSYFPYADMTSQLINFHTAVEQKCLANQTKIIQFNGKAFVFG